MINATKRCGGAYIYANQQGCDGGRLYYDGCASVIAAGGIVAQGSQFSVRDVEVVTAVLDVTAIRAAKAHVSRYEERHVDWNVTVSSQRAAQLPICSRIINSI